MIEGASHDTAHPSEARRQDDRYNDDRCCSHRGVSGLGTTVVLGPKVTVKAEAGQPNKTAMDEDDLRSYRAALMGGPMRPFFVADKRLARAQR